MLMSFSHNFQENLKIFEQYFLFFVSHLWVFVKYEYYFYNIHDTYFSFHNNKYPLTKFLAHQEETVLKFTSSLFITN